MVYNYMKKRTIYQTQINNSQSIGVDETIVPCILKGIFANAIQTGSNTGNTYYSLLCIAMSKEPIRIKLKRKKIKKQAREGDGDGGQSGHPGQIYEPVENDGTVIEPRQEFWANIYDASPGSLDAGAIVKLSLSARMYNGEHRLTAGSLIADRRNDALCDDVYLSHIMGTALADIPHTENMTHADFPEGTPVDKMTREFITPLSEGGNRWSDVDIQMTDEELSDPNRLFCTAKDDKTKRQYPGVNRPTDTGVMNGMKLVLTPKDEGESKVMLSLAYGHDAWSCFGCANAATWAKVASRLMFGSVGWYVFGSTKMERLKQIIAVSSNDDDDCDEDFIYSTAYVKRMALDLKATVRNVGIPLTLDFVRHRFSTEGGYANRIEYRKHPINDHHRTHIRDGTPFICNMNDLSLDQVGYLFDDIDKSGAGNRIKFFGIYQDSSPYEFAVDTKASVEEQNAAREAFCVERKLVPDMVFCMA